MSNAKNKRALDMNGKPYSRGLLMLVIIVGLFGTYTASHKSKAQPIALTRSSGLLYLTFA